METNTQTHPTVATTALRYGLFTGIISILYSFVLISSRQLGNTALGWVALLIPAVGIVLAMRDFRQRNGGYMSYGEGVGLGALLSLVSGVLSMLFNFVYRLIDPSVATQAIEQARAKLEQAGTLSEEQIDQGIAMSQKFTTGPVGFMLGIVGALFIGTILALIIAAFLKNPKPEFE